MGKLIRDEVGLAYEEAGSGAPPIVLVHNLGSDHSCFDSQFQHFSCRHRVVAVDIRSHGQSDRSNESPAVTLLADDLAWLCFELGLYRPVVLGLGLGGIAALDLAARYQDLPAAIVVVSDVASRRAADTSIPLTLSRQVATTFLKSISTWDRVGAIAGSGVPVLHIALASWEAADCQRDADPSLATLTCASRQGRERGLPEEINQPVDEFLLGRADWAPP